MWRDFKRPQKSEPSSVLTIRRFVIVSSSIILLGSILALFFKMFKEQPIISTTFSPVDVLPAPVIYLGFKYNFTINCSLYYSYDGVKADKCNNYVTKTELIDDDNYPFAAYFYPKKNLSLHKYEDVIGPYFVFLDINIVDPNFPKIINDSAQISSFRMIAFDSNNDYIIQNKSFISPSHQITPFEKSLYYMNKYTLSSGYV
ncbi:22505_t:CDS:2, partial [Gigaspora rosea]